MKTIENGKYMNISKVYEDLRDIEPRMINEKKKSQRT